MNRLFTIFAIVPFVVHALFGCCLHHTHACDTGCCETPAATAVACPCHGHAEEGDTDTVISADSLEAGNQAEHSQHRPHRCEGEKCSFVRTVSPAPLTSLQADAFLADFITPDLDKVIVTKAAMADAVGNSRALSHAPPLYISLAVLLI